MDAFSSTLVRMREVSCRALSGFRDYTLQRGVDWRDVTSGLRATPDQLRNQREWIDWEDFAAILERVEIECGVGSCAAAGRSGINSEVTSPLRRLAGGLLKLTYLYRFGVAWLIPFLLREVQSEFEVLERDRLRIQFRIPQHFPETPLFFQGVRGGLEGLPSLVGLSPATVVSDITGRAAVYDIRLPRQRVGVAQRIRLLLAGRVIEEVERQGQVVREIDHERTRVEGELRERERMLSNLLENLSGLAYRCRVEDLRFEYASPQSALLTGLRDRELVDAQRSLLSLVHREDRQRVRDEIQQALERGASCTTEYRLLHSSGEVRWVLDVSRAVFDAAQPVGIEGFITDITERKRLEAELEHALRQESIGRLAGGVAHDFNNMLTVITTLVELIQAEVPAASTVREYNEQIGAAADRAAGLTRKLLEFARRQPIAPQIVNLNSLIQGMEKLLQRTLMENVRLEHLHTPELWNVRVDPREFEQVLLNLAINARHAMPAGGSLVLETSNLVLEQETSALSGMKPGRYVLLRVADTGVGMDVETQKRAFEPFFTTKQLGAGTGLGLASTHGIVTQAGGCIYLKSEPGGGTEFSIYLPRAQGEAAVECRVATLPRQGRGERVLLVEDNEMLLEIFGDALERQGYCVSRARSAEEALERVSGIEIQPDLLITDVILPELDGPSLCENLRRRWPELPALFISGYSKCSQLVGTEDARSTRFLPKPFTPTALSAEVDQLLQ